MAEWPEEALVRARRLSKISQKKRQLAVMSEIFLKSILLIKMQLQYLSEKGREKKGKKEELNFGKLLKRHIEKMSTFDLSKMSMKTNNLNTSLQDVIENKGGY